MAHRSTKLVAVGGASAEVVAHERSCSVERGGVGREGGGGGGVEVVLKAGG